VREDEAGQPGASAEGLLAAVALAVVSFLLVATLRCDIGGTAPRTGARSEATRPAGQP